MANPLSKLIPFGGSDYPKSFLKFFQNVVIPKGANDDDIKKSLWKAYEFGTDRHRGQKRRSGKPYFSDHCLQVAKILAKWNMDHITIMAGLLHDTIEDTETSREELTKTFGEDISRLVDGVTKIGNIEFTSKQEQQVENYMKMLLSVAKDLRVIIIKFADRIHNMQTLEFMPNLKQRQIARETNDLYVPLANRLGMASVKWELEDWVLKTLHKKSHIEIDSKLKSTNRQRKKYINQLIVPVQEELKSYEINADIYGRPKSHSSIYRKMKARGKKFEEIYDIFAIRIIVEKIEQCYLALGVIHKLYSPIQERFKDFIAMPKSNGYQSIHTTVVGPAGHLVEIQIRTQMMEQTAEIGVAAHWRYKEGKSVSPDLDSNVKWLRELVRILQSESSDPKEFMNLLKIDLFDDEVFVFSPKGDLIQLPLKSCPIDFAFEIHTQVGLHCIGAKINHKIVPLNTLLKNGDIVEILTNKNQRPSYGWLKFISTTKARTNISRYLRRIATKESLKIGAEILEKTLRRLKRFNLMKSVKESFDICGYNSTETLLEAIGNGSITVREIFKKIRTDDDSIPIEEAEEKSTENFIDFARSSAKGIKLQGIKNLMVNFGKCCTPIPGDEMIGFVTRGRGITVHRSSCKSLPLLQEESDRLIPVEWDVDRRDLYAVQIKVVCEDKKGRLQEMTECIGSENINITNVEASVKDGLGVVLFIIHIKNLRQLDRIIRKITMIDGIDYVERTGR